VEAHRVVTLRGSNIFQAIGSQMAVRDYVIGLCILCYVTVSRLVGNNYSAVGRRGLSYGKMAGTKNFCLPGELSQHLLTPVHCYFLLTWLIVYFMTLSVIKAIQHQVVG
jgi:hypothetical protein